MTKKYGGKIENWFKQDITESIPLEQLIQQYGPNLGYLIHGGLGDDPTDRGFAHHPIRTSLVVKQTDSQIETLNTIYDLGKPRLVNP